MGGRRAHARGREHADEQRDAGQRTDACAATTVRLWSAPHQSPSRTEYSPAATNTKAGGRRRCPARQHWGGRGGTGGGRGHAGDGRGPRRRRPRPACGTSSGRGRTSLPDARRRLPPEPEGPHRRYYEIAGVTLRVESPLPILATTFAPKFALFEVDGPGPDTVVLRHHFGLPTRGAGVDGARRAAARSIASRRGRSTDRASRGSTRVSPPTPHDPTLHLVAAFDDGHTVGDLYHPAHVAEWWRAGGLGSLTHVAERPDRAGAPPRRPRGLPTALGRGRARRSGPALRRALRRRQVDDRRAAAPRARRSVVEILCDDRTSCVRPLARGLPRARHLEPRRRARRLAGGGAAAGDPLPRAGARRTSCCRSRTAGRCGGDCWPRSSGRSRRPTGGARRWTCSSASSPRCRATRCASTAAADRARARGPPVSDYVRRVGGALPGLTPRLASLDVELTERCDNDCIHCCINLPAGDAEARAREMTTVRGGGSARSGGRARLPAGALHRRRAPAAPRLRASSTCTHDASA